MNQDKLEVDTNTYRIVFGEFKDSILKYWAIVDQNNNVIFYNLSKSEVETKLKELQK